LPNRHLQRTEDQLGPQMVGHGPADDATAEGIQNDAEVERAGRGGNEDDVGNPELVRPLGRNVAIH